MQSQTLVSHEYFGTTWLVPVGWSFSEPGVISGPEGVLKLHREPEGRLIDEARCREAASINGATWSLVRTSNGVAVSSCHAESGFLVAVYVVRAEADSSDLADFRLPEISASYVISDSSRDLFKRITSETADGGAPDGSAAIVDDFGHLLFGPLPISGEWRASDSWHESSAGASHESCSEDYNLLVGGGWVDLVDSNRSCGFLLAPLPIGKFAKERAIEFLKSMIPAHFLLSLISEDHAEIFQRRISEVGITFRATDLNQNVRRFGAIWSDQNGQVWRGVYFFDECNQDVFERLSDVALADVSRTGNPGDSTT